MKIIVAPDKFKGSLTSFEACYAIETGIKRVNKNAEVFLFPMADGGDGFAEVMKYYLQTDTVGCTTVDPLGRSIPASYQWNPEKRTAIIELAVASGLVLLTQEERNPLKTSTFGTGLLINHAIDKGAEKIILGLGGSATNDAGMGILSALEFQFRDRDGNLLNPCGESLAAIEKIISPSTLPNLKFVIASDVQNVLYGAQGAAYIYGPQKGADAGAVRLLDEGLKHFADILKQQTGKDVSAIPGTGAAGGIAAGLMGFFEVELKKGIDLVIEASGIKNEITGAALLITGEGKIDDQTLQGKLVDRISSLAYENKVPAIAFCGLLEGGKEIIQKLNLFAVESLVSATVNRDEAMANARDELTNKTALFLKAYFKKK